MAQAKEGDKVKVNYTGKLESGEQFDSTSERGPFEFEVGKGQVIAGFDEAIKGMEPGDKKTVTIPMDKAYGPHQDNLVAEVNRSEVERFVQPELGQQLEMRQQDGQRIVVKVTEVSEEKVTLDANHPLAGEDLTFDIELVDIG